MPQVKVIYNRQGCIGTGACCVVCPKYCKIVEDGRSDLLGSKENLDNHKFELEAEVSPEDLQCLKESADSCPVQVIKVEIKVEEK